MELKDQDIRLTEQLLTIDTEREIEAGARWMRDYLSSTGKSRFVVGLSGGLDSAVTAMWGARAIGNQNMIVVRLPYGYIHPSRFAPSVAASSEDADLVAKRMEGADYRTIDIAPAVDAIAAQMGLADAIEQAERDGQLPKSLALALGNLKARVRATILRTITNVEDALLLGTGNKTEYLLAYFTTGGDEESDLEILQHYLKAEVRQLAKALGVPQRVIDKAPSADLWTGQTDENELGFTYAQADLVLRLTEGRRDRVIERDGLPGVTPETVRQILDRVDRTAFKRAAKPIFPRYGA